MTQEDFLKIAIDEAQWEMLRARTIVDPIRAVNRLPRVHEVYELLTIKARLRIVRQDIEKLISAQTI